MNKKNRAYQGLLALITFISYWPSFSGEFLGDDFNRIVDVYHWSLKGPWSFISHSMPDRPLLMLSIYFNYFISDLQPWGFKLVNIIGHIGVGLLLFYILEKVIPKISAELSFLLVALFLIHPLNSQVIGLVVQRGVIFASFFLLCSFLFLFQGLETKKKKDKRFKLFLSWICFFASILFKPITITYPIFVILYLAQKKILKKNAPFVLSLFLPILYPWICFSIFKMQQQNFYAEYLKPITYLGVQMRVWWVYFKLFLWPHPLKYLHNLNVNPPQSFPFLYLLLHLAIITGGLFLLRKKKLSLLFFSGFFIFLLPESSIFSIRDTIFEHRFYLPMIFLFLFISTLIPPTLFSKYKKPFVLISLIITLVFSTLTFRRMQLVSSLVQWQEEIYQDFHGPHTYNMHFLLNLLYLGMNEKGKEIVTELRKMNPNEKDYILLEDLFFYEDYSLERKTVILEKVANTLIQTQKYILNTRLRRILNEFIFAKLQKIVAPKIFFERMRALYTPQKSIFEEMDYSPPAVPSPRGSETP